MNKDIFHEILATISKIFSDKVLQSSAVANVKNNVNRDVVTELDIEIHQSVEQVLKSYKIDGLISEEGDSDIKFSDNINNKIILLDPLDGSLNYATGLDFYCSMIAYIDNGIIEYSGMCIPSIKQLVIFNRSNNSLISSKDMTAITSDLQGPTYLAYGSTEGEADSRIKSELIDNIDKYGNGLIRLGSAGYGVYLAATGRLTGFVGLNIKICDALQLFPIARYMGLKIAYGIHGENLNVIMTSNMDLYNSVNESFKNSGYLLNSFNINERVEVANA